MTSHIHYGFSAGLDGTKSWLMGGMAWRGRIPASSFIPLTSDLASVTYVEGSRILRHMVYDHYSPSRCPPLACYISPHHLHSHEPKTFLTENLRKRRSMVYPLDIRGSRVVWTIREMREHYLFTPHGPKLMIADSPTSENLEMISVTGPDASSSALTQSCWEYWKRFAEVTEPNFTLLFLRYVIVRVMQMCRLWGVDCWFPEVCSKTSSMPCARNREICIRLSECGHLAPLPGSLAPPRTCEQTAYRISFLFTSIRHFLDSKMPSLPAFNTNTPLDPTFDTDIKDTHLIYSYNAQDAEGNPEKWKYEMRFFSSTRVVYKIHGGPMAGRTNYQTCSMQCIRPGELWQVNWLEETGTICSLVYDIPNKKISTLIAFSKGHWEQPEDAHGDKRNAKDFERWKTLAEVGKQSDRYMLSEQADIAEVFKGKGDLEPIEPDAVTL